MLWEGHLFLNDVLPFLFSHRSPRSTPKTRPKTKSTAHLKSSRNEPTLEGGGVRAEGEGGREEGSDDGIGGGGGGGSDTMTMIALVVVLMTMMRGSPGGGRLITMPFSHF